MKIQGTERSQDYKFYVFEFSRCEHRLGKAELDWVGMHLSHTSHAAARVL